MSAIDLGKIMITPAGTWRANRSYEILSVVEHNGSGYLSLTDNTGVTPGTDPYVWMLFAQAGESSVLTIDTDGVIYKNGEQFTSILADAMRLVAAAGPAEEARVQAESARAQAEVLRDNAEAARVAAAQERIADCLAAASEARQAAGSLPEPGDYVSRDDLADVATSGEYADLRHKPAYSTDISADRENTTKLVSPKAVYDFIVEVILSTI